MFQTVLPWLIVGLGCWVGYLLVQQNGRVLLRLEEMEEQLAHLGAAHAPAPTPATPSGLPVGSEAPLFELPTLDEGRKALSDFRGKRVLLIFFNPRCGFCVQMAPDLAALPTDGAQGRPIPLVVTTGDPQKNRELVREHGIRCPVLLQEQFEVASRYQSGGTPTGYLIDEEGRIASELATGAQALLELVDAPSPRARSYAKPRATPCISPLLRAGGGGCAAHRIAGLGSDPAGDIDRPRRQRNDASGDCGGRAAVGGVRR